MADERSKTISGSKIALTEELPLLRLKQLCSQGHYRTRLIWDRFDNGFMITCELFYFVEKTRRVLTKEVQWVETEDLEVAQNTVAAVILHRLNLGPEEIEDSPVEEPITHDWASHVMEMCMKPLLSGLEQEVGAMGNMLGAFSGGKEENTPPVEIQKPSKTWAQVLLSKST